MVLGICLNIFIKIKKIEIRKYIIIFVCYCFVMFEILYRFLKKIVIIWFIFGFIFLFIDVNLNWFFVLCFKYWKKVGGIYVYYLVFVELIFIFNFILSGIIVICCVGCYWNFVNNICEGKVYM